MAANRGIGCRPNLLLTCFYEIFSTRRRLGVSQVMAEVIMPSVRARSVMWSEPLLPAYAENAHAG